MSCSGDSKYSDDIGGDRDDRAVRMAAARSKLSKAVEDKKTKGIRSKNWHGAERRMTSSKLLPSREDEFRKTSVAGRYVPLGFAKYVAPVIDPTDYTIYRVAGWRVVIPRATSGMQASALLNRIFNYGPQSAGMLRVGDTLVPALLSSGDRLSLAQSTLGATDDYPLTM